MSGVEVKALLDGRKTQTRRVIRKQPTGDTPRCDDHIKGGGWCWAAPGADCGFENYQFCPYGVAGDRLWSRETHRFPISLNGKSAGKIADACLDAGYRKPWAPIQYDADKVTRNGGAIALADFGGEWGKLRPSIFMPRWASRITLEITGVRVERVQDITPADVKAEGLTLRECPIETKLNYHILWDSLHGKGAWERNDWVWVLEFRDLSCNSEPKLS